MRPIVAGMIAPTRRWAARFWRIGVCSGPLCTRDHAHTSATRQRTTSAGTPDERHTAADGRRATRSLDARRTRGCRCPNRSAKQTLKSLWKRRPNNLSFASSPVARHCQSLSWSFRRPARWRWCRVRVLARRGARSTAVARSRPEADRRPGQISSAATPLGQQARTQQDADRTSEGARKPTAAGVRRSRPQSGLVWRDV